MLLINAKKEDDVASYYYKTLIIIIILDCKRAFLKMNNFICTNAPHNDLHTPTFALYFLPFFIGPRLLNKTHSHCTLQLIIARYSGRGKTI